MDTSAETKKVLRCDVHLTHLGVMDSRTVHLYHAQVTAALVDLVPQLFPQCAFYQVTISRVDRAQHGQLGWDNWFKEVIKDFNMAVATCSVAGRATATIHQMMLEAGKPCFLFVPGCGLRRGGFVKINRVYELNANDWHAGWILDTY